MSTLYGHGTVLRTPSKQQQQQQQEDSVNKNDSAGNGATVVQLTFGKLYIPEGSPMTSSVRRTMSVDEYSAAYESLEQMRRLKLEAECHALGIDCDYETCVLCLLTSGASNGDDGEIKQNMTAEATTQYHTGGLLSFGFLKTKKQSLHDNKKEMKKKPPTKGIPCLICGDPVCKQHASASFAKEKLTLCLTCEQLFQLNFSPRNTPKDATATTNEYDKPRDC